MLRCRGDCGRVRGPMRTAVLAALASLVLAASGCKSQCRLLREKQCDCTSDSTSRNNCLATASTLETNNPPSAAQETLCEALMDQCDCRLLDTQAGKERCGVAVGAPDGGP